MQISQSRLLQHEKMASVGQLAAGVAHEINNPTGFIISNLGSLSSYISKLTRYIKDQDKLIESQDATPESEAIKETRKKMKLDYIINDAGDLISESSEGAKRIKHIVQDLKNFARVDEEEYKSANINECLESTLNIVWNELKYNASVEKDYGDLPTIKCYPRQLNQVFMNLLVNAAHSIETQGEIKIKTSCSDTSIDISISDTGCGIPEEIKNRVFDPFFTTKDVGQGMGLGLSMSYDIVEKHNGHIAIDSKEGEGTTFIVSLPVSS